ncbi:MAG: MFS transporter [Acidimicrobiales bacterium]
MVLTTIVLYYLYYVEGAVTPLLLPSYHMSFQYFLYVLVIANAIGAFTAFIGGLSDKIGRANLTIYGTLIVGVVQLSIPHIHDKLGFVVAYCIIGFVEGVILVSTPALMRDFSPQLGRGAAMGFWALGPTMGSLAASLVATRTLPHLGPWQDQFDISGLVCIGVVVISFVCLRELAPRIRDQLMVSEADRVLVEARAMGVDIEAATAHPIRTMLKIDLVASSFGIAVFLLFYYASVSVLTIYWVVVFNRSTPDADGINVWYAAVLSGTLVFFGVVSDRLRVRKPLMLVGAAGSIVMMIVLILQTNHPHTGYYSNVLVIVLLATAIGCAYCPWMAGYTEQIESHNPALAASGLAIWGWILRIVVAVSFLVLPHVITTATTLVDNYAAGNELQAFQTAQPYAPSLAPGAKPPAAAPSSVITQLQAIHEPGTNALADILSNFPKTHPSSLAELQAFGAAEPYVPSTKPGAPIAPAAPPAVLAELRATGERGPEATAVILQNYAISHNVDAAAEKIPASLGGVSEALALEAFNPLASAIQAGQPVTSAEIAKVADANLQQVLRDELLLVPPGTEAPALLKFQPLASVVQAGGSLSNSQIASVGAPDLESLLRSEKLLVPAQKESPNQWKRWWWVCIGGMVVFFGLVFTMRGRWSPRAAKRDIEARERLVAEELAKLHLEGEPEKVH